MQAYLALEDGTVFTGEGFGASGKTNGEVVFNTSMTGYQEILTDPSYRGQIVSMTYPLIGNYGVNRDDSESGRPQVRGFVVREWCRQPSNWRSQGDLNQYLMKHSVIGLEGIDTRALTRRIRNDGAMRGVIAHGEWDPQQLINEARQAPYLSGQQLVPEVTVSMPLTVSGDGYRVLLLDFGVKQNIIRWLRRLDCTLTVLPATTSAQEILDYGAEGVVMSNGPGDPQDIPGVVEVVKRLLEERIPLFGICMGHQLLGLALGGKTYKLPFGHRGANHPVKDLETGKVYITSQNHGYALEADSLDPKQALVSHINLNDGTVEGVRAVDSPAFGVQYHPESSPGPTDNEYLFDEFIDMIKRHQQQHGGRGKRCGRGQQRQQQCQEAE